MRMSTILAGGAPRPPGHEKNAKLATDFWLRARAVAWFNRCVLGCATAIRSSGGSHCALGSRRNVLPGLFAAGVEQ